MAVRMKAPVQARAQETRDRLVRAAARCLSSLGFHKTSTQRVAERAGCSQGALFKHFPTKSLLLAACVENVLAGFVADFAADVTKRVARSSLALDERIDAAVHGLWQIFRRREMHAVFEVYVAARTDDALGLALQPILDRHRANILDEARRLFPEIASRAGLEPAVDAIVYAMQGAVLGLFAPDGAADAQSLALFQRLARNEVFIALREAEER